MSAACGINDFGARLKRDAVILHEFHRIRVDRRPKTWPAGTGIIFLFRPEQRHATIRAHIRPWTRFHIQRAAEGASVPLFQKTSYASGDKICLHSEGVVVGEPNTNAVELASPDCAGWLIETGPREEAQPLPKRKRAMRGETRGVFMNPRYAIYLALTKRIIIANLLGRYRPYST